MDFIEKTLKVIFFNSEGPEIFCAYKGEGRDALLAGLDEVRERRAKGDLMKAVLVYGFDPEDRIRKHESGSILSAPWVFYLRLPALLSDVQVIVEKTKGASIPLDICLDEKNFRDYALKKIRAFKHRCDNVLTSIQMNIGRARRSLQEQPKEWPVALQDTPPAALRKLKAELDELLRLGEKLKGLNLGSASESLCQAIEHVERLNDSGIGQEEAMACASVASTAMEEISRILEKAKGPSDFE